MNILGIFNGKNASAALIRDGKLSYAAQEERFSRVKFHRGYPELTVADCLARHGLAPEDIDIVACGAWSSPDLQAVEDFLDTVRRYAPVKAAERMYHSLNTDSRFRKEYFQRTCQLFPRADIQVHDHHYAHACTAFFCSGYGQAHVITSDGRGDLQSLVIWKGDRKTGLTRLKTFCELKSLGALYGQVTGLLGFTPDRHEGKILGLAAFGKPSAAVDHMRRLIRLEEGDIAIAAEYVPFQRYDYAGLAALAQKHPREDVAFAVQAVLEEIVLGLVRSHVPTGADLCLAGGTFANVKLNQKLREQAAVGRCFVFPEMGDGGIGLGGALAAVQAAGLPPVDFSHVFLGPQYQWEGVDLGRFQVERFDSTAETAERAARHICDGEAVAVFSGRMEFGPRALGARSIMAQATDRRVNMTLNTRLNRTEFMPFAPVTLREHAPRMYQGFNPDDVNVRFMTTCYTCTPEMASLSPGVTHVDGTARPQVIARGEVNDLYFDILAAYHARTGIPSLVNTSFNNHEEPIVCTPQDALDSLAKDNVDHLATETMLISRR